MAYLLVVCTAGCVHILYTQRLAVKMKAYNSTRKGGTENISGHGWRFPRKLIRSVRRHTFKSAVGKALDLENQKGPSNKAVSYIHMFGKKTPACTQNANTERKKSHHLFTAVEDKPLFPPSASQYLMSAEILHYTWRLNPRWSQWKGEKKAKNVKQRYDRAPSMYAWKSCSRTWIMHGVRFPSQNNKPLNEKFERGCNLPGWREHKIDISWLVISQKGCGFGNPQFKLQRLDVAESWLWLHLLYCIVESSLHR